MFHYGEFLLYIPTYPTAHDIMISPVVITVRFFKFTAITRFLIISHVYICYYLNIIAVDYCLLTMTKLHILMSLLHWWLPTITTLMTQTCVKLYWQEIKSVDIVI